MRKRTEQLNIRLTPDEVEALRKEADRLGLTAAAVLRLALRLVLARQVAA